MSAHARFRHRRRRDWKNPSQAMKTTHDGYMLSQEQSRLSLRQNGGSLPQMLIYSLPVSRQEVSHHDPHREFELLLCNHGFMAYDGIYCVPSEVSAGNMDGDPGVISLSVTSKLGQLDRWFCDKLWGLRSLMIEKDSISVFSTNSEANVASLTSGQSTKLDEKKEQVGPDTTRLEQLIDELFNVWPRGIQYYYVLGTASYSCNVVGMPTDCTDGQQESNPSKTTMGRPDLPKEPDREANVKGKGKRQLMALDQEVLVWRCLHEACSSPPDDSCDGNLTSFETMIRHAEKAKRHKLHRYQGKDFSYYLGRYGKRHKRSDEEDCEIMSALLFRCMCPGQPIPYLRYKRLPDGTREPVALLDTTRDYMDQWNRIDRSGDPLPAGASNLNIASQTTGWNYNAMQALMLPEELETASHMDQTIIETSATQVEHYDLGFANNGTSHAPIPTNMLTPNHSIQRISSSPSSWDRITGADIASDPVSAPISFAIHESNIDTRYATARSAAMIQFQQDYSSQLLVEDILATTKSASEDADHEINLLKQEYEDKVAELDRLTIDQNLHPTERKRRRDDIEHQRRTDLRDIRAQRHRVFEDARANIDAAFSPHLSAQLQLMGLCLPAESTEPAPHSNQSTHATEVNHYPATLPRDLDQNDR